MTRSSSQMTKRRGSISGSSGRRVGQAAALGSTPRRQLRRSRLIRSHGLNPKHWALADLDAMMKDHLDLTLDEAVARLQGRYADDIVAYGRLISGQVPEIATGRGGKGRGPNS
jgi:hypothetical protein